MRIHHIGYLVTDIDRAIEKFCKLGYKIAESKIYDADRKIEICFLENDGIQIELVNPQKDSELLGAGLKKIGNAPYHICYESNNFENVIEKLKMDGYILIKMPEKAIAINNRKVAFLFNKDIGLLEILEKKEV